MNTLDFLNISVAICPDRDSVVFEGKRYTFNQINETSESFCNGTLKGGACIQRNIEIFDLSFQLNRPTLTDNSMHRAAIKFNDWNLIFFNLLIVGVDPLQTSWQINPELNPCCVSGGHLGVNNATTCRKSLRPTAMHGSPVTKIIGMLHTTCKHIGNRLKAAMWMIGKTACRNIKMIPEHKRVEVPPVFHRHQPFDLKPFRSFMRMRFPSFPNSSFSFCHINYFTVLFKQCNHIMLV